MFINKYRFNGSSWLVVGIALLTMINGCDKIKSCTSLGSFDGKIVSCYPKDLTKEGFGKFCTSSDKPPCECWDLSREINQLTSVPWLDTQCDPSIGNIGSPGTGNFDLSEAYKFECPSGTDETLCAEFDFYFNDNSFESNDHNYRPVYVRFSLADFSIKKFDYLFQVIDLTNTVIDSYLLTGANMSEDRVRRLDPASCGESESCATVGVVKMDIKGSLDSPLRIRLKKVALENGAETQIEDKFISGRPNEDYFGQFSSERKMPYVTLLGSSLVSPQNGFSHYQIAGKSYSDAMEHVFGNGKSNLRIYNQGQKNLSTYYMDDDLDIKLDRRDYDNAEGEPIDRIFFAMRRWTKDVYLLRVLETYRSAKGFLVVPDFVNAYNLTTHEMEPGFKAVAKTALAGIGGITFSASPDIDPRYFNGIIMLRDRAVEQTTGSNVSANTVALWYMLHEFGHLWAPTATDPANKFDDCYMHSELSNGRSYDVCLFHHSCQETGEAFNAFFNASVANLTFCEGHQQYFMNRLNPR